MTTSSVLPSPAVTKWIWFDLDDTLIDFATNAKSALRRLYREYELCQWFATEEKWISAYEANNHILWDKYARGLIDRDTLKRTRFLTPLTEAGLPEEEARRLNAIFDPLYLDYLAQEKELIPDARETLEELRRRGYSIGIISNGFKEVQHRKIARAGLTGLLDCVVLSDDVGVTKPDPAIFHHAAKVVGEPDARRHVMIGDNLSTDIAGSLAAGWRTIWLDLPRCHNSAPTPAGAIRITSLKKLLEKKSLS